MSLATVTVDFDVNQILGATVDSRRVKCRVYTNVANQTLMDTSTGEIRMGNQKVTVNTDGTGEFTTWAPGADGNPISWQTYVEFDYPRAGLANGKRIFGPYTIDTTQSLALYEEEQAVPAEYLTTVTALLDTKVTAAELAETNAETAQAAAEAARDAAVAIAGPVDATVEALVRNTGGIGPLTSGALSDTIAAYLGTLGTPLITNPGGLTRWRTARDLEASARTAVIVEGDSITAGAYADDTGAPIDAADSTAWENAGFVGKLRTRLADLFGSLGIGYESLMTEDARWVFTGTQAQGPYGVAGTGRRWTDGGTATFDAPACTGVDVIGIRRNGDVGGNFTLTGGGVAHLFVDTVDVTPNAVAGSGTPGVAALTAGWTGQNGAITYAVESGENVMIHTSSGTGALNCYSPLAASGFAVTAGQDYLLTAEGYPDGFDAAAVWLSVRWYDVANAQISETPTATGERGRILNGVTQGWTPVTHIVTAPTGAVKAALFLDRSLGAVSEVMKWRRAKMIPLQWHKTAAGNGGVGSASAHSDLYRYGVDGLANTAHDIELQMSTGTCDVAGIRLRSAAATAPGVIVHRAGRSGSATVEHVGAGWSTGTKADLLAATTEAVDDDLSLLVIALGANDWNRQVSSLITPTVFKTHITTMVTNAVALGASVLLVAGPRWEDDSKTYLQQEYADALREVAEAETHCAFIDLRHTWGGFAEADAKGYMYDSPHPNSVGHNDYGRILASILGT